MRLRRAFQVPQWNIGIVDEPAHAFLRPGFRPSIRWLPELPRGHYLADPFVFAREGRTAILVEEFSFARRQGRISVVEALPDGSFSKPAPVLHLPVHASYPFVVEHDSEIYCVPETAQAKRLSLFRCIEFPHRWTHEMDLVEGVAALDPTIFRHGGRWWLFCTDRDRHGWSDLCAWFSDDIRGPWQWHERNPLKSDLRSSRPAGTPFIHEGHLYRPAQDNSRGYGGALILNRVDVLTPDDFHETEVTRIEPDAGGRYPEGLHTLSAGSGLTVIDGKRSRVLWNALPYKIALRRWRSGKLLGGSAGARRWERLIGSRSLSSERQTQT